MYVCVCVCVCVCVFVFVFVCVKERESRGGRYWRERRDTEDGRERCIHVIVIIIIIMSVFLECFSM